MIISGGYNIYPREIEELLEGYSGVSEAAVVGLPDEEYGERVVAAIVRESQDLNEAELINLCRQDLAGFKRPREVVFMEELPRNALGKVQKHLVRDQLVNSEEET